MPVKSIIFDLGGVIINLDQQRTIEAFNRISEKPFQELYSSANQSDLFNHFDKGEVSSAIFFSELRKMIRHSGPDEELLTAWNAMLLDIPESRLEMLVKARQKYKTFLLSNTCEPHIEEINKYLYNEHGVRNFSDYFEKTYYSCRVGLRKPDPEIFNLVLRENNLNADETVFIDDTVQHVRAAGECGIRAYLLEPGVEAEELLSQLKLL